MLLDESKYVKSVNVLMLASKKTALLGMTNHRCINCTRMQGGWMMGSDGYWFRQFGAQLA